MLGFFLPCEHTPSFLYKPLHGFHINLTPTAAAVGPVGVEWGQERAAAGARPLGDTFLGAFPLMHPSLHRELESCLTSSRLPQCRWGSVSCKRLEEGLCEAIPAGGRRNLRLLDPEGEAGADRGENGPEGRTYSQGGATGTLEELKDWECWAEGKGGISFQKTRPGNP